MAKRGVCLYIVYLVAETSLEKSQIIVKEHCKILTDLNNFYTYVLYMNKFQAYSI